MILHDEIYFEITLEGSMDALEKFESFALSGVFDDFFDVSDDYIIYEDSAGNEGKAVIVFTNDDFGIEIDRFDVEDFLDIFCKGAEALYVNGCIYDIDDEEYRFVSQEGDSSYTDAKHARFNDELDEAASEEEYNDEEDYN